MPGTLERLRKLTSDGIDAVLALAGGDELERCLDFVRDGTDRSWANRAADSALSTTFLMAPTGSVNYCGGTRSTFFAQGLQAQP